jgi:hypothetical protein
MVGEAKEGHLRGIRAQYFQLREAIIEHERKVAISSNSDPQAVADLAQRVASAIQDSIKDTEDPPTQLVNWLLEAEGAIMLYSSDPNNYFKNMPKRSPDAERRILNKFNTDFFRQ